jgi:hypothetical protein
VRKRYQKSKQALKEGREPTGAEKGAEADTDSAEEDMEVRQSSFRILTQPASWSASIPSRASLTSRNTDENQLARDNMHEDDGNDPAGDLEELEHRMEEGETFDDE